MNLKSCRPFDIRRRFTCQMNGGHSGTWVQYTNRDFSPFRLISYKHVLSYNQRWLSPSAEDGTCPPKVDEFEKGASRFKFVSKPRLPINNTRSKKESPESHKASKTGNPGPPTKDRPTVSNLYRSPGFPFKTSFKPQTPSTKYQNPYKTPQLTN